MHSEKIDALLVSFIKKVKDSDGDMQTFLDECVGGIAKYYVCMQNAEHNDIDACNLWDQMTGPFEVGVKIGQAITDREILVSGFTSDDEIDDPDIHLGAQWLFWFVARDVDTVLKELEAAVTEWVKKERKENGLLPFEDTSPS